ncbi:PqqD family protein [Thiocapsa sp.]|uniref:PqqD family protein n=1 Tax=Thiocapsa sp. TaxID=2024551 RepID=UPI002B610E5B|nr:PqqD family protein [Thiocapsa sp.]HSO81704.1 PqqD family protein [Thiocapsa sp.]
MTLTDTMTIPPQVMTRRVGDEAVVLDLATGTYFGLDPVGARMWELMGEGKTLGEMCDRMLEEYEVTREELERDALRLIEELKGQGLVQIAG